MSLTLQPRSLLEIFLICRHMDWIYLDDACLCHSSITEILALGSPRSLPIHAALENQNTKEMM